MPKIHAFEDAPQREDAWFRLRIGKVTASEADCLLTPEFKERTGEMPKSFLCKKLAEVWQGHPLPGFTSFATEQGNIKEDEALPFFRMQHEEYNVHFAGFVETDDGLSGCSPDALIGDDGGLEIKSPNAENHVRMLLGATLPKEYAAQVHFQLYVTGRPWWIFLSYRRKFPPFIITVKRDEEICSRIHAAVLGFHARLEAGLSSIKKADEF